MCPSVEHQALAGGPDKPRLGKVGSAGPGGLEIRQGRRPVTTLVYVEIMTAPAIARIARGMFGVVET